MTYIKKLKDPRWQKKRLEIMNRDYFKCVHCNDEKTTLNVHHKKYTGEPWEAPNEDLETVCEDCHSVIDVIEDLKSVKEIKYLDIFKSINLSGFSLNFVTDKGVMIIDNDRGSVSYVWIKKMDLESILKTINNE